MPVLAAADIHKMIYNSTNLTNSICDKYTHSTFRLNERIIHHPGNINTMIHGVNPYQNTENVSIFFSWKVSKILFQFSDWHLEPIYHTLSFFASKSIQPYILFRFPFVTNWFSYVMSTIVIRWVDLRFFSSSSFFAFSASTTVPSA